MYRHRCESAGHRDDDRPIVARFRRTVERDGSGGRRHRDNEQQHDLPELGKVKAIHRFFRDRFHARGDRGEGCAHPHAIGCHRQAGRTGLKRMGYINGRPTNRRRIAVEAGSSLAAQSTSTPRPAPAARPVVPIRAALTFQPDWPRAAEDHGRRSRDPLPPFVC